MNWLWILYFSLPFYYARPVLAEDLEELSKSKYRLLELEQFSLKFARFGCNRDLQTPNLDCYEYVGRVAAEFDLRLLNDWLYWNNEVHGEGTRSKFETMGWHYELGLDLGKVQLFWEHHSRHVMDREQPYYWDDPISSWHQAKYPVEDSYGIRLIFYRRDK